MEVRGRLATVMGLGRHGGGVAVARWLAEQGAIVTVTDTATSEALADSRQALADVGIAAWHLAEHREADFDEADLVVINPAVRPGHPLVARARSRGATITSELELFLTRCPGPMIGVTGSNGKSTTAAMIAAILGADGRQVFLGGNIGRSLLADLPTMTSKSWTVLEISSFQLAWLSANCPLPDIGLLTNITPNHLDWHGTLADYTAAKARLFHGPRAAKMALFGEDSRPDSVLIARRRNIKGVCLRLSATSEFLRCASLVRTIGAMPGALPRSHSPPAARRRPSTPDCANSPDSSIDWSLSARSRGVISTMIRCQPLLNRPPRPLLRSLVARGC